MARTLRRKVKTSSKNVRDGADLRVARSCGNHGSCNWCRSNRTHKHRRAVKQDQE
jgi:hypothetical protein